MSRDADSLLAESLSLPVPERARLAARLLASLQPPAGTAEEIELAWDAELGRRLEEVDSGTPLESWESIRARALARLREKP